MIPGVDFFALFRQGVTTYGPVGKVSYFVDL